MNLRLLIEYIRYYWVTVASEIQSYRSQKTFLKYTAVFSRPSSKVTLGLHFNTFFANLMSGHLLTGSS